MTAGDSQPAVPDLNARVRHCHAYGTVLLNPDVFLATTLFLKKITRSFSRPVFLRRSSLFSQLVLFLRGCCLLGVSCVLLKWHVFWSCRCWLANAATEPGWLAGCLASRQPWLHVPDSAVDCNLWWLKRKRALCSHRAVPAHDHHQPRCSGALVGFKSGCLFMWV